MSSCSAWMYRPASASARPEARTRTSFGASSGGVHGASSPKVSVGHRRANESRADGEDGDSTLKLVRERFREAMHGRLARRVGGRLRARKVCGTTRRHDDSPPAGLEHARDDRAAAEEDAEHVHLVYVPPRLRLDLPDVLVGYRDPCVRGEQVDRPQLAFDRFDPPRDVLGAGDVAGQRESSDVGRDSFDLLGGAPGDGHRHACIRELASDRGADPAPASGDERDAFERVSRHARSRRALRGSRAWRGRRDPRRARGPGRRDARPSRCASSAGPTRRSPYPARTPCPARGTRWL